MAVDPTDERRTRDEQTAARMGISVERLHEIDREVAADVAARDAVPPGERELLQAPRFSKGFGPNTPGSTYLPPGPSGVAPKKRYDAWTRQAVFFYPVTRHGEVLGYVWASTTHNAASFVRKLRQGVDPMKDRTLDCADAWGDRLDKSFKKGLSAQDAVRRWVGKKEHRVAGGIAADAPEGELSSLAELYDFVNPGGPVPPAPLIQDGTYPDGTPEDRSHGWGPLGSGTPPTYPRQT